jgi:phage minor structural protein
VNCSGLLARLEKTDNVTYDTTATPKTPTQIITALLALQEFTPALTVGTIEPTTTFALAVENTNLLTAVLKCTEYLGGYIDVSDTGALNWWNDPSGNPTREIRYRKNLKGMTRKREFYNIRNKIYAYGAGETEAQITLIDAGEAQEYIQDATSQTAYGVRIKRITDKRITHPATLLRWAQRYLAAYKDPVYSYTVDAVNLAAHPSFNFDLEELEIGQIVRVKNIDINLDVDVKIVALTTNLSSPEDIQVELANATPDLADLLGNAAAYQALSQNVAVTIGAGQVVVQGSFVVLDWATSGQTTIDGGNITANTLTADAIKTSTLNAKTITLGTTGGDSIIKSGNYSAGSAGWQIKANGDAEFNNVTVRGNIGTCSIGTGVTVTVTGTLQSNTFDAGPPIVGWKLNSGTLTCATHKGVTGSFSDYMEAASYYFSQTPLANARLQVNAAGTELYFIDDSGNSHTLAS